MSHRSENFLSTTLSKVGVISVLIAFSFLASCKDDKNEEVKPDKFLTASIAGKALRYNDHFKSLR